MDLRSITRGVILQALYELDSTQHPIEEVLKFRTDLDRDEDSRLQGYLALYLRHLTTLQLPPTTNFELPLNKPQEQREPFEQVLIDVMTEGLEEETIDETMVALLERGVEFPDVEDFDLKRGELELLPLVYQRQVAQITRAVLAHRQRLDDIIFRYAPDYPMDQMALIDRNILRLAIYEFSLNTPPTPLRVAISEAVELSKLFGAESTPRFVNGVLGALSKEYDAIVAELAKPEEA